MRDIDGGVIGFFVITLRKIGIAKVGRTKDNRFESECIKLYQELCSFWCNTEWREVSDNLRI